MPTMLHSWSLENIRLQGVWLAIGSFDGVHLGHQAVLNKVIRGSHIEGVPAAVLTFYPHPAAVLGKRGGAFYLNSPEEKAEIMSGMGLDALITHPFNREVSRLSARDFSSIKNHLDFAAFHWARF
jgi:riboflavin kinase/FMN adenylyltransferase